MEKIIEQPIERAKPELKQVLTEMFPPGAHPLETDIILHEDGSATAVIHVTSTQNVIMEFDKKSPEEIESAIAEKCKEILSREGE